MDNKIEIEFANGKKIQVHKMDGVIFNTLQEEYKSAIVKIDKQPSAIWVMTNDEIKREEQRINNLKRLRST